MSLLIPVKYNNRGYPSNITPKIQEVAGHFDKKRIAPKLAYSLHTEYSFGKRELKSALIENFNTLSTSHKDFVPQLWFNIKWAEEFIEFIQRLVGDNKPPKIIEIHPAFDDYCKSIADFIKIYEIFEKGILTVFSDVEIVIENRFGSRYRKGNFLISTAEDLFELHQLINTKKLKLRIVLDFPQLFTSYRLTTGLFTREKIESVIQSVTYFRESISGIHIWGKKKYGNKIARAHMGNLDTYFEDENLKEDFLRCVFSLLDDGKPRYFVPEVNSNDKDLAIIVQDFIKFGFKFV